MKDLTDYAVPTQAKPEGNKVVITPAIRKHLARGTTIAMVYSGLIYLSQSYLPLVPALTLVGGCVVGLWLGIIQPFSLKKVTEAPLINAVAMLIGIGIASYLLGAIQVHLLMTPLYVFLPGTIGLLTELWRDRPGPILYPVQGLAPRVVARESRAFRGESLYGLVFNIKDEKVRLAYPVAADVLDQEAIGLLLSAFAYYNHDHDHGLDKNALDRLKQGAFTLSSRSVFGLRKQLKPELSPKRQGLVFWPHFRTRTTMKVGKTAYVEVQFQTPKV